MIPKRALLQSLAVMVIVLSYNLVLAAIPPTLNYQGHLTDDSGVPVDGSVAITFRIYDAQTTTTPLWSSSQTVTVHQGVFSVELGSSSNPFPLHMFDNPLWLGLSVGSDAEMTPRRPITTTAFAYRAQDADMLDGSSASAYDQSAHLADTGNPHGITPSQIGAAAEGALSAHAGDTTNPHNVSAAQTGAATPTDILLHSGNVSAHHFPYSDFAAVNAMGAKGDVNPLHHDRYTEGEVVTAMLANDGAGSTLDSDRVDGLEASELIDASQDEVRTPISSLPYTISQSGSYYLTGNLDGSAGGIDITADKVTLDLMGFTIDGGGTVADYGISFTGYSSIVVRNGFISNFGYAGIYQGNPSARFATVMDVQVLGNGTLGTEDAIYSGILIYSNNSHIERCTAGGNGGYGIHAYFSSKLIDNTAYGNSGTYAVVGGTGSTLTGNTAYNNSGTYAIFGASGSSITGNTAYSNSHWGIYGFIANLIKDNTLMYNNSTATAGMGGLRVGADSRVIGNTLYHNWENNIVVSSSDNTVENNLVTDSTNGIFFNLSGNFYGNNRAAGNTTNFNLNGTVQTTNANLPNISF